MTMIETSRQDPGADVFSDIYRGNVWNGVETRSGPGSGVAATARIRDVLLQLVDRFGIRSVVDAACGEAFWQPELPGYLGLDVAEEAIAVARQRHPDWQFEVHDIRESCPRADLVLVRDVIQHLSLEDGVSVIDAVRASGSTWLLASTFSHVVDATEPDGRYHYHEPNLEQPPFGLPPALELFRDGFDYDDPDRVRDWRKMLGLWRLA